MTKQPDALRLADEVEDLPVYSEKDGLTFDNVAIELRRLHEENVELLTIIKDLQESASYWCDYEVPVEIVERMNAAIELHHGIGDKT